MNIGLDTSVVMRLLTREPEPLASSVAARVAEAIRRRDRLLVSDLVVAECYFALQHHFGLTKAQAIHDLRDLLSQSGIGCRESTMATLRLPGLATKSPGLVDRLIHADSTAAGARLWSCERSAAALAAVEILA